MTGDDRKLAIDVARNLLKRIDRQALTGTTRELADLSQAAAGLCQFLARQDMNQILFELIELVDDEIIQNDDVLVHIFNKIDEFLKERK